MVAVATTTSGVTAGGDVSQYNLAWTTPADEPSTNKNGNPVASGGMPIGNGDTTALVFPVVNGSTQRDPCDARVATDFCQVNNSIPCHDSSCQLTFSGFTCAVRAGCAEAAAEFCGSKLPGCVAFAILNEDPPAAGQDLWLEFYHNASTIAHPFPDNDWTYYYNSTAVPPHPADFHLPSGSVNYIVAKADAMASDTTLFKLGMVSLVFEPNPFASAAGDGDGDGAAQEPFEQTLDLSTATVTVATPTVNVSVWVDAASNTVQADVHKLSGACA